MKRGTAIFSICGLLGLLISLAGPATAGLCSSDNGPAATLLLPYFEVDLDRPLGQTTLMAIGNVDANPHLVNVTIWSDLGVPVLWFNLYLTGYDIHTLNLRDFFSTDVGQITGPTVTPAGPISFPNLNFPNCENQFPGPPALPALLAQHMRASLTGRQSPVFDTQCSGLNFGDNVARGYVTVDVVNECAVLAPGEEGYFGPDGVVGFDNVLFGDFFYLDVEENFAQGESLIRIQADPTELGENQLTFYGSLVGYDSSDAREPLTQHWASRFLLGGDLNLDSELIVWRDHLTGLQEPFTCGSVPPWFPLDVGPGALLAFDEQEDVVELQLSCPNCSPLVPRMFPAPAVAQRVSLSSDLFIPWSAGWLRMDLSVPQAELPFPPSTDQAAVVSLMQAAGRFSVGFDATPIAEDCRPFNLNLP